MSGIDRGRDLASPRLRLREALDLHEVGLGVVCAKDQERSRLLEGAHAPRRCAARSTGERDVGISVQNQALSSETKVRPRQREDRRHFRVPDLALQSDPAMAEASEAGLTAGREDLVEPSAERSDISSAICRRYRQGLSRTSPHHVGAGRLDVDTLVPEASVKADRHLGVHARRMLCAGGCWAQVGRGHRPAPPHDRPWSDPCLPQTELGFRPKHPYPLYVALGQLSFLLVALRLPIPIPIRRPSMRVVEMLQVDLRH